MANFEPQSNRSSDIAGKKPFNLISFFARHRTAGNLLMIVMIIFGLYGFKHLKTQFFPTIEIPAITISISWPGASPEDVEKNILDAVEPEVRFLDGVDEVTSYAREGIAFINIEFFANADMQKALSDVEQAVSRLTILPDDSEDPVITRINFFDMVANILISADMPEQVLKSYAKQVRNHLLKVGLDQVSFSGYRDEEIEIVIKEKDLQRLGLTLSDISNRIAAETKDLPSGTIEGNVEMQLRALIERKDPETIGQIEIKTDTNGQRVLLRDVAKIKTEFDEEGVIGFFEKTPAIKLTVSRALSSDTLSTMRLMEKHIAELKKTLPPTVRLKTYDVRGKMVKQRLWILVKNGLQGLVLVLITLFLFLNWRVAFWVAIGIPVAFMATLCVMWLMGQSLNMVSMFGLIMMLGIIVDDAIVVGEDAVTRLQKGLPPIAAAESGALRMAGPVIAASLTTFASFLPIFLIGDRIGDMMAVLPLVVIAVLFASLIECFLILPAHLGHTKYVADKPGSFRLRFDQGLTKFKDGPYRAFVKLAYDWRYTTVAISLGILISAFGLLAGGRMKFDFLPSPEPEKISARVVFGAGTPIEQQKKIMLAIDRSVDAVEQEMAGKKGSFVENKFIELGKAQRSHGDNLAQLTVQLTPSEDRTDEFRTKKIVKKWRQHLPSLPGLERIALSGTRVGPPGNDLDVQLQNAPVEILKRAAIDLQNFLQGVKGVSGVSDDLPFGKPELIMTLTPRGSALGFTTQMIGTQLRNHFQGAIPVKFARGDEEITVRLKLDQPVKGLGALEETYVTSPTGQRVPLREVVSMRDKQGFSAILRRDGVTTVSVFGDIDIKQNTVEAVTGQLRTQIMPSLVAKYGISYDFTGREKDRVESFADLRVGSLVALALIYVILAWVFASYWKPIAVMSIIPFGLIGAILGHYIMGMDLTMISMLGLLGLSGILVNDSIVLLSQIDKRMDEGDDYATAAINASCDRLRAVLLTSLTTIGGLFPLLFEPSRAAQFLIPMAITMVFGLATATLLVLVLVPAVFGIGGDVGRLIKAYWQWGRRPAGTSNI